MSWGDDLHKIYLTYVKAICDDYTDDLAAMRKFDFISIYDAV